MCAGARRKNPVLGGRVVNDISHKCWLEAGQHVLGVHGCTHTAQCTSTAAPVVVLPTSVTMCVGGQWECQRSGCVYFKCLRGKC